MVPAASACAMSCSLVGGGWGPFGGNGDELAMAPVGDAAATGGVADPDDDGTGGGTEEHAATTAMDRRAERNRILIAMPLSPASPAMADRFRPADRV